MDLIIMIFSYISELTSYWRATFSRKTLHLARQHFGPRGNANNGRGQFAPQKVRWWWILCDIIRFGLRFASCSSYSSSSSSSSSSTLKSSITKTIMAPAWGRSQYQEHRPPPSSASPSPPPPTQKRARTLCSEKSFPVVLQKNKFEELTFKFQN